MYLWALTAPQNSKHYTSNVPVHQSKGLLMCQLHRARTICNSLFKIATTNVVLRLLMRQHPLKTLVKSWNSHLHKFSSDKITNYSQLRSWFNRMLYWANKQILSKKVFSINFQYPSIHLPIQYHRDNIPVVNNNTITISTNDLFKKYYSHVYGF